MADFSPSGIVDLPPQNAESLRLGDLRVVSWVREAVEEGDRINKSDPSYDQIDRSLQYITGEQLSPERKKLRYLPQVVINESRKAIQAHVSALTDLKPLFGWRTLNPQYRVQADLLNQYAVAEWVSTLADIELGDCIKYALSAGTGDLVVDWDPHAPLGGAHSLSARDPRDTLPIRPSHSRSLQLWEGVVLREEHTINVLQGMYPQKANLFRSAPDNALGRVMGRFRTIASRLLTPADPLDSIGQMGVHTRKSRSGSVVMYRTYLHDRTMNLTGKPITMGEPGTAWSYVVQPNERLYPRGRLIVTTDELILYDGPNPYWHGLFPICRLRLWSVPWQLLGIPLFNDLLPVQDAINDTVNDLRLGIQQWMDPDVIYNRTAVSENTMRTLDPRRPGKRIKVNASLGEPYQKQDGPSPQVLTLAAELWQQLTQKHNDLSGTANLQALMQLRQMPSADTIQKYYEALTPEIRQEARQIEGFMRDLAEMTKVNYFQFLSSAKRVMILGDAGVTLNDFDFDPGTLVPALKPGDPGYTQELDVNLTTHDERAQWFHRQFMFVVAPNSILAINAQEQKMMRVQLARMGYYDFWSLHETLETPNVGAPPAVPLPPLEPVSPETQMALLQHVQMNLQNGMMPAPFQDPSTGKNYIVDPNSGQILELRIPQTVTERLQAQALLQIGMSVNPAGRKASGQEPPKNETKSDGRQTTTESNH